MAVSSLWDSVLHLTKFAQDKGTDPLLWARQLSSDLSSSGVSLPSHDLANLLVSHICWDNNVPLTWKFLEKALMFKMVPPLLVLALLSVRVIPNRRTNPAAFRIYMELLKRHAFTLKSHMDHPNYQLIMDSINEVLNLSELFGLKSSEPGVVIVQYIFSIVLQLLDSALEDEGLLELTPERESKWLSVNRDMELDGDDNYYDEKRIKYQKGFQNLNTVMAAELIGQFLQNNLTSRILYLAHTNMPRHWRVFVERIHLLAMNSSLLRSSNNKTSEVLVQLVSDTRKGSYRKWKTSYMKEFHDPVGSSSLASYAGLCHGVSRSSLWLPIDLELEDAMDGSQVTATSAVESITGLVKALQAINGTTWHDSFLGLWMAALRLIQRERDPVEGPVPRLDSRMCMLLSITTLVVADLIEEDETTDDVESKQENLVKRRRNDLVSSLQSLRDYQNLLTPPQAVISACNQAAAKAMMFISGVNAGSAYFDCITLNDMPLNCSGNLHHLIVEACIARNLVDTSAYFWTGYVNGRINQIPQTPVQVPGWSSFMKGAPLTPLIINALVSAPASRYTCNFFV